MLSPYTGLLHFRCRVRSCVVDIIIIIPRYVNSVNNFGASFKVYESTGTLTAVNFALGYNKTADYNYNIAYEGPATISSLADAFADIANGGNLTINSENKISDPNGFYDYDMNPYYWGTAMAYKGGLINRGENGWYPDFDALEKLPLDRIKLMWINYPHMPTGAVASKESLQAIVEWCRNHHILLVNDNPYCFLRNDNPLSLLSIEGAKDAAIELNSLSKSHNMAGWRIGMVAGAKERIDEILRFKSNMDSGMFLPLQLAAATALSLGDEWYAEQNRVYRAREAKGLEIMEALGVECRPHQAGLFLWGRVPNGENCYDFCDKLLYEKHIFVTPGGIFGDEGDRYVRMSLCAPEGLLQRVLDRIKG